jgi:hypothetical protein
MLSMISTGLAALGQVPTVQHEVGRGFAQILEYSFEGCEVAVNIGNNGYPHQFSF